MISRAAAHGAPLAWLNTEHAEMSRILIRFRVILALATITVLAPACVSTNLAPIGGTNGRFALERDEADLWSALRQAESKVAPQSAIYQDDRLTQYLTDLANRLTPAGYREAGGPPLRVLVRKDPRLNAGAMAHGLIVVNTGILARVDNEAQLAAVLGHEITHIAYRHQIREYRALQNRQTAINIAAFVGTLALAAAAIDQERRGNSGAAQALVTAGAPLLQVGLQLSFTAMVSGYSRELEEEADTQGLRLMANAGYPPAEMACFFRVMLADSPDRGAIETFFWGNHPRTSDRIAATEALTRTYPTGSGTPPRSPEFEARLAPVRIANAGWDAYLGRVTLARSEVDRTLRAWPDDARRPLFAKMLYGMVAGASSSGAQTRGQTALAAAHFDEATTLFRAVIADAPAVAGAGSIQAQAYRQLGLLHYAQRDTRGRPCEARAALEQYLELAPAAPDRVAVSERIRELTCTTR
jgi:predicted Zn-dependent protease